MAVLQQLPGVPALLSVPVANWQEDCCPGLLTEPVGLNLHLCFDSTHLMFFKSQPKSQNEDFLGFCFSLSFFTVFKCHSEPLEVAEGGGTFCSWCHGVIPAGIPH